MLDPLLIAAIRRVALDLGGRGDEDLRELGGLVALLVDALSGAIADHNFALERMLLFIEHGTAVNDRTLQRLNAIDKRLEVLHERDAAGAPGRAALALASGG